VSKICRREEGKGGNASKDTGKAWRKFKSGERERRMGNAQIMWVIDKAKRKKEKPGKKKRNLRPVASVQTAVETSRPKG